MHELHHWSLYTFSVSLVREYICSYWSVCLSAQPLLLRSDNLATLSNLIFSLECGVPSNFVSWWLPSSTTWTVRPC